MRSCLLFCLPASFDFTKLAHFFGLKKIFVQFDQDAIITHAKRINAYLIEYALKILAVDTIVIFAIYHKLYPNHPKTVTKTCLLSTLRRRRNPRRTSGYAGNPSPSPVEKILRFFVAVLG